MEQEEGCPYPAVKRPEGEWPEWWRDASSEQKQAWWRMDGALAEELGYERPYASGPNVGTCPGTRGSTRGHGLTASSTHWGGCCSRWDAAWDAAIASGQAEPTDEDRAEVARRNERFAQHWTPAPDAEAGA